MRQKIAPMINGNQYVGDCETTTDILGPFYRPDSPNSTNLRIRGDKGVLTELNGIIRHNDYKTPYDNAKIKLWHCQAEGVYDNKSGNYRYRGTTYCNEKERVPLKLFCLYLMTK